MLQLRPGVIAVMLSLIGSGAIEPDSVALGSDFARANDAATPGADFRAEFEVPVFKTAASSPDATADADDLASLDESPQDFATLKEEAPSAFCPPARPA